MESFKEFSRRRKKELRDQMQNPHAKIPDKLLWREYKELEDPEAFIPKKLRKKYSNPDNGATVSPV